MNQCPPRLVRTLDAKRPHPLIITGISFFCSLLFTGCGTVIVPSKQPATSLVAATPKDSGKDPLCYGKSITICDFPGEYPLDKAISLVLNNVGEQAKRQGPSDKTLSHAHVACAEVAYPGGEKTILAESSRRGTFICLFNNSYAMNMSLNRLSTFIEDFETVDSKADYSEVNWSTSQATETTMGHNLESPDILRYMRETQTYIKNRTQSSDLGTRVEAEFLKSYISLKIQGDSKSPGDRANKGKPQSIFLGVPLPELESPAEAQAQLTAVLGHEIFHALYFHSAKLQTLVKDYIDKTGTEDTELMKRRLSQKGYAVTNDDGSPPSAKQTYMFYNESLAYLLESGACTDGAFMSYRDDDQDQPKETLKNTAPLVVKHAANLRKILVSEGVITPNWATQWSPDLIQKSGCQANP